MPETKARLVRKAILAQYALLAYNLAEGFLSVFFGLGSGSVALFGFGLDSFIEAASTAIVLLRLKKSGNVPEKVEESHELRAFRLVGALFILLAIYVAFDSARKLLLHEQPQASLAGIAIALASIVFMGYFSKYRHGLGHKIGSRALIADSRQTQLCVFMSYALLAGIGLNILFGWWWADPLAGIAIAALAFIEGKKALEGKTCC